MTNLKIPTQANLSTRPARMIEASVLPSVWELSNHCRAGNIGSLDAKGAISSKCYPLPDPIKVQNRIRWSGS
jgi:hypothetical protein